MRHTRTLRDPRSLLDQLSCRRGLGDEGEATVLINRDLHRNDGAAHRFCCRVVGLAELHDVDPVRTECGTDGGSRCRCARVQGNLDERSDLLLLGRHFLSGSFVWSCRGQSDRDRAVCCREAQTFWICGKVRSTGVSRPRISTSALSRWLFTLISVIVAWTPANGPSTTMTESPTAKSVTSIFFLRRAGPSLEAVAAATTAGASIFSTSSRLSGTGEFECPTNPVTDGVWRTVDQDSSVKSIRTRT